MALEDVRAEEGADCREERSPAKIKSRYETIGSLLFASSSMWFLKKMEKSWKGESAKSLGGQELDGSEISLLTQLRSCVHGSLDLWGQ